MGLSSSGQLAPSPPANTRQHTSISQLLSTVCINWNSPVETYAILLEAIHREVTSGLCQTVADTVKLNGNERRRHTQDEQINTSPHSSREWMILLDQRRRITSNGATGNRTTQTAMIQTWKEESTCAVQAMLTLLHDIFWVSIQSRNQTELAVLHSHDTVLLICMEISAGRV